MWIVKNPLKATLTLRGLGVSIAAGEEIDLDAALGRERAETSNQVQVAFEEGYLENVYKEPREEALPARPRSGNTTEIDVAALSAAEFDDRMERFKTEFLAELRERLPALGSAELSGLRESIHADVKSLVDEMKTLRERFASVKGRVERDESLSSAEVKARLAFLEEQERELLKNFETVGKRVESDDGDVMDMADRLSEL
ncbi:MAG: hypothetical protein D6731_20230 [Planctomycetota bacterium]|nr:MAG: hypothetical protein D6731_20230 [Planctomycetota bacterium]